MSAEPDQIFLDIYLDLGELARDIKAIQFRARKLTRKLMQRRTVFRQACADMGIHFVDSSTATKEAQL